MGIISQLTNLITFLSYFIPLGIPNGLSKFVAEIDVSEKEKLNRLFLSSLSLVFYPAIVLAITIFLVSNNLSLFLFETYDYAIQIKIISAFIPFIVLNTIMEGYLRGLKVINVYVKVIIFTNIFSLLIILPLVYFFGLNGGLTGVLFSNLVYILVSFYYLKKERLLSHIGYKLHFDGELFRKIMKVSFAFLISGAFFQLTLMLLRKIIIANYGIYYNGIYQSVIGISITYFGFIFLSLSTYSFPTISKLQTNDELIEELNTNVKFIISFVVPLVIIIFVFRKIILTLLFSSDFIPAEKFFSYQFMGDYFKALAWALGIWFIPKMKLKVFLALELILNLNLVLISYLFLHVLGLSVELISLAYLISYIIHFILNLYFTKILLNFKLYKSIRRTLILSFFIIIPMILISQFNIYAGYIVFIPLLFLWFKISLEKNEIMELRTFILSKLNLTKK